MTIIHLLPPESLAVICSFICNDPNLLYSFLTIKKDWYYTVYRNEHSIVWSVMMHSRTTTTNHDRNVIEQMLKEKKYRSYRELILSLWNDLVGCGPKSSLVFKNDKHQKGKSGICVKLDTEMANLFNNHNNNNNNNGFTVELWINFHRNSHFPVMCCLTNRNWVNGFGLFKYTHEIQPSTIDMFVQDWYVNPNFSISSPTLPPLREWHHFAGVFNTSDTTLKIYMDGELKNSKIVLDHNIQITSDMALSIGFSNYMGDIAYHVVGEFTDIRVWNVARSDKQIKEYFNKRFSKHAFLMMNQVEYEGLVFNFYPIQDEDSRNHIQNKSPNSQFKMEKYSASNEAYVIRPPYSPKK